MLAESYINYLIRLKSFKLPPDFPPIHPSSFFIILKIKFKLKKLLIPLILMLSGCTTLVDLANKLDPSTKTFTVPYIEPDVQTNCRIRVISDTTVKILPNRSCVDWNAPGAGMVSAHSFALGNDKTHNDKVIGIPRAGEIKNSSEVYIKPNEPLVLVYGHKTSCLIEASFIPEENTDYQILSDTSSGRCTMELSKVTVDKATNIIIYTPLKLNNAYPCKE